MESGCFRLEDPRDPPSGRVDVHQIVADEATMLSRILPDGIEWISAWLKVAGRCKKR
jgi:hypothetical protein